MPASPSPRFVLAAAVVAAAAAFGIGFVVGTPAQRPAAAEPLETVAAPGTATIPALRGDLEPLPPLAAPTVTPRTGSGSSTSTPLQTPSDATTSVPHGGDSQIIDG
jgi:hypothetical protein